MWQEVNCAKSHQRIISESLPGEGLLSPYSYSGPAEGRGWCCFSPHTFLIRVTEKKHFQPIPPSLPTLGQPSHFQNYIHGPYLRDLKWQSVLLWAKNLKYSYSCCRSSSCSGSSSSSSSKQQLRWWQQQQQQQ